MKVQADRGQKWIQEVQQTQFLFIQESGVSSMVVTQHSHLSCDLILSICNNNKSEGANIYIKLQVVKVAMNSSESFLDEDLGLLQKIGRHTFFMQTQILFLCLLVGWD